MPIMKIIETKITMGRTESFPRSPFSISDFGFPNTMRSKCFPKLAKIITKNKITSALARKFSELNPELSIKNSLIKILNGGIPMIANPPIKNIKPVTGIVLIIPLISTIDFVCYFCEIDPLEKNRSDFTTA